MMTMFGFASVLPWNLMITAHSFYVAKFSQTNSKTIVDNFPSYIEIVGIVSNFGAAFLAVFILKVKNLLSVVTICNIVGLIVLCLITSTASLHISDWAYSYFVLTLVLFGVVMSASAIYMAGMAALASIITPNAIQGFYLGQGAAGLFSALISIGTIALPNSDPVSSGFYYFLIASITLKSAIIGLVFFSRTDCVRAATSRSRMTSDVICKEEREMPSASAPVFQEKVVYQRITAFSVLKRIWKFCLTTLLTTTITSVCFPAALSMLRSSSENSGSNWVNSYYLPVTVFLVFSVGDLLGRVTANFFTVPCPDLLLPLTCLRALLVPCIYMCNLQPRHLKVWFRSDLWAPCFNFLLSWSNGNFISRSALHGTQCLETKRGKSLAGTLLSFSFVSGLLLGAVLVFPFMRMI